jgi:hypothetical protein
MLDERPWDRCTLFDAVYRPRKMSVEELEGGFAALLARIYSPEASERRKLARRSLRETAKASSSTSSQAAISSAASTETSLPDWHQAPPS